MDGYRNRRLTPADNVLFLLAPIFQLVGYILYRIEETVLSPTVGF